MKLKFDDIIEINGTKLTKKYIESLSYQQRQDLVEPIFQLFRENGFPYPDDISSFQKDYQKLVKLELDLNKIEVFNNSSCCTEICRYFCRSFYGATDIKSKTMLEIFNNDQLLKRLIFNRLGGDWLLPDKKGEGVNESFNFTTKQIIQGMRSMRLVASTSMFKPDIAKYMCLKYSELGDTVGDYSCGFGGRLLGAMSCGRKYIGTDPLTVPELEKMAQFFQFKDYQLIHSGSENYRGQENSIDLYWSSPPYFAQELYTDDITQAYNQGEDYFYNIYWKNTLENIKYMLKPNKWFGLNVKNYPKMLEMAEEIFGKVIEQVSLKTIRSHLNKTAGTEKFEYIYMFRNIK
jgi:hypothetical protein